MAQQTFSEINRHQIQKWFRKNSLFGNRHKLSFCCKLMILKLSASISLVSTRNSLSSMMNKSENTWTSPSTIFLSANLSKWPKLMRPRLTTLRNLRSPKHRFCHSWWSKIRKSSPTLAWWRSQVVCFKTKSISQSSRWKNSIRRKINKKLVILLSSKLTIISRA